MTVFDPVAEANRHLEKPNVCDECKATYDDDGGTDLVDDRCLCWDCVADLERGANDKCDCDLDAPCIHHLAANAIEHAKYDGRIK